VLHVDSERGWRGGQQQVAWLLQGTLARGLTAELACRPGSILEERGRTAGWTVHAIAMRSELDLASARRIAATARAGGLAILHAHSGHALALCLLARLFAPGLLVVASRRVDFPIGGNPLSRLKYRTRLLDRVICISEAIRTVLVSGGVPEERLVVIPSGVDTRRFEHLRPPPNFRRKLGVPDGHLLVGTVAALADHKDYPTLLRAARAVLDRAPDTTFVAVGDGPLRDGLVRQAAGLGLGRRFLFTGFREDVGNFLKVFDLFVLASKLEGMGTSLLDAQAVGLPVVACRAGGIPEAVREGETGLLVPPGDPAALAGAILALAADPERRRALGARARLAAREHDVSRTVAAHVELYASLVAR
jgi:glycosyltransferase involved in cell wall biosynthesis